MELFLLILLKVFFVLFIIFACFLCSFIAAFISFFVLGIIYDIMKKIVRIAGSQGTKSWFFGSHSIVHSITVIIAWKKLYGSLPKFWQIICILVHDIGYIGMNHLQEGTNLGHSVLGGKIAYKLFGQKGWDFVVGHSRKDADFYRLPLSSLEPPDDYSSLVTPTWWINFTSWFENVGISGEEWKNAVRENWEKPERTGGTDLLNSIKNK